MIVNDRNSFFLKKKKTWFRLCACCCYTVLDYVTTRFSPPGLLRFVHIIRL